MASAAGATAVPKKNRRDDERARFLFCEEKESEEERELDFLAGEILRVFLGTAEAPDERSL